ncbi:uncharacterized protein BDR25DRAFT_306621 [Lindgomyces ingoldianus]|uniref:Uncharacterized protein n=1 Tax=Lindgomyces ingoldianus TaxID=673940 RepID=A0ACB6QEU7_9PLEO|nr:uncharacterized protein BDR25DRAFT_306621 [Lindgomyces ingoldianus]KAF2465483.1 hypothetical protein BDR25DRAFT_306621 [Lindgomyces ingoldianus]
MMLSRLPSALSLLLITSWADAAPGFIPRDPAHALEGRAPTSNYVARNATPLPAQICGLVGGYVLTVLIWGVLLLTVGRRMRRKTQTSPKTLELELVTTKPPVKTPASPGSARSVTSWSKKLFKKPPSISDSAVGSPQSPVVQSPSSFDQKVVEADRERAQAEMERLYAAVMDHDRKKSYSQVSTTEHEETGPKDRRPSEISTSATREPQSNPSSPIKAIYPPGYHNGPPTAPLPRDRLRDQPPASPRSILSKKSHNSIASSSSKTRFNLKNLRISGPIQKYPGESVHDEARTPLSPRFYNPGAPPSPPTQQNSPATPGDEEAYEKLDEVQPLPHPAPQRVGSSSHSPTTNGNRSATSSSNSLPLRGFAEPLKSPELRTTYVDRRMDKLSMTTPKTGVPYTPYSPYMPFTPVTPITPHLVTKKDRKASKKIQGRKLATHEDMVQSPKEIFGDAY